ncbi:Radical SAM domain protein, partial [mine drainage metagenome]
MLGKCDFDFFLSQIESTFEDEIDIRVGIQTNAMLINDEWIDLFEKHKVSVGVSLDGPKETNDKERRDHRGHGTYTRTVSGLIKLQDAARRGRLLGYPGIISVIDPTSSGRETYRHFVDELGVHSMSFHLPMDTYESFGRRDPMPYATFICDVFDEWARDNNPEIYVRMFDQFLKFLRNAPRADEAKCNSVLLQHLTVESDGAITIDELKPTLRDESSLNVSGCKLLQFVNSDIAINIRRLKSKL